MAKTIKFNLILDKKPVRDIESLRDNFNVSDILDVYENRLLHRWLKVRKYDDFLEKVEGINEQADKDLLINLANIFEIKVDKDFIDKLFMDLDERNTKKAKASFGYDMNHKEIIKRYHLEYDKLINSIHSNKDSIGKLKAICNDIEENYVDLFIKDIYEVSNISVMLILLMLSKKNGRLREYILKNESIIDIINENILADIDKESHTSDIDLSYEERKVFEVLSNNNYGSKILNDDQIEILTNKYDVKVAFTSIHTWKNISDKDIVILDWENESGGDRVSDKDNKMTYPLNDTRGMLFKGLNLFTNSKILKVKYAYYDDIKNICNKNIIEAIDSKSDVLNKNIKVYNGTTERYWKEIEGSDKKVMIIYASKDSCIRNYGDKNNQLTYEDINGKFPILNGLELNNNSNGSIVYMEV